MSTLNIIFSALVVVSVFERIQPTDAAFIAKLHNGSLRVRILHNACHSDQGRICRSRRDLVLNTVLIPISTIFYNPLKTFHSQALEDISESTEISFRTTAFNLKEYTNSIVASKDTNVSPKEAYDVLVENIAPLLENKKVQAQPLPQHLNSDADSTCALDVGAGAGVSTQTLYEMGLKTIDAVDWSGSAWNENVVECPPSVTFYEMDDERFFAFQKKENPNRKYQVIVYNFAINLDKAIRVATEHLDPDADNARLLAPANVQKDYWYKQTYYLINSRGEITWKSNPDVGAWSVQFQPDVTEDTCQGIWCPPYNGFVKKK